MADDDIYGSRIKYENFKANLHSFALLPSKRKRTGTRGSQGQYHCRNPVNLKYFRFLFAHFEAKDISYIRRNRMIQSFRLISYLTTKDLADCGRDDINDIVAGMHKIYGSPTSKQTFLKDIKHVWKLLFPERDSAGRPDETLVPYVVRHLSAKSDRSRQKMRQDKLTWDEFERIVDYFGSDPRMQAYLTLALESLGRPQELLYRRIRDVELHDNYAKIYLTEHGKEGVGLLQCIDSYPYLLKWLSVHPLRKNPDAFLFVNTGDTNRGCQLKPKNINRMINTACKDLGIEKPVTCYSLKRNGVTIRRLRGESDMEIQHAARWTSTKQLKTYDLSTQDEAFKRELEKRGLVPSTENANFTTRKCMFCNAVAGFGELACHNCQRPLDRNAIVQEAKQKDTEIEDLKQSILTLSNRLADIKEQILQELARDILAAQNKAPSLNHSVASSRQSSAPVSDFVG